MRYLYKNLEQPRLGQQNLLENAHVLCCSPGGPHYSEPTKSACTELKRGSLARTLITRSILSYRRGEIIYLSAAVLVRMLLMSVQSRLKAGQVICDSCRYSRSGDEACSRGPRAGASEVQVVWMERIVRRWEDVKWQRRGSWWMDKWR